MEGFNATMLSSLFIPYPDNKKEQIRLVDFVKGKAASIQRLEKASQNQLTAIEALPAAILREAFAFQISEV